MTSLLQLGHALHLFFHSPVGQGAFIGWLGAAAVDWRNFRAWKSFDDARSYSWGVAVWRWVQGAIVGAVGASSVVAFL